MKARFRLLFSASAIAAIALFFLPGCKENTIINSSVVPVVDNIHTFEMNFPVSSGTIIDDTLITSTLITPIYQGLGRIDNDPFFGKTDARLYLQFIPAATGYRFPSGISIDSSVLILPYSGFTWGDTANTGQIQRYQVYRMTDSMTIDSLYYSTQTLAYDPTPLQKDPSGQAVNIYNLKNDVYVGTDTLSGFMRIPLSAAFTSQLVNGDSTSFSSYAEFLKWFRGICVVSTGSGSSIPYVRLDGSSRYTTAGIVFYHADSVITSFSYNTSTCAHYNRVKRDYSGYPVAQYITNMSAPRNDSVFMIQNKPGLAGDIYIRGVVDTFNVRVPEKSLVVNKATLIVTKVSLASDADDYLKYTEPSRIYPVGVAADTTYSIADRYPLTSNAPLDFIGGNRKQVTIAGITITQYELNIPRELQDAIAKGKNEIHLRLNGTNTFPGAYRLIAGGGTKSMYNIRLNVIYSKLKL